MKMLDNDLQGRYTLQIKLEVYFIVRVLVEEGVFESVLPLFSIQWNQTDSH